MVDGGIRIVYNGISYVSALLQAVELNFSTGDIPLKLIYFNYINKKVIRFPTNETLLHFESCSNFWFSQS